MLDDVEAASARLVAGTLKGDTLKVLLMLVDAIELPTAELLLSEIGKATVEELANPDITVDGVGTLDVKTPIFVNGV